MSRLSCKTTLLDRVSKPGMIGALGVVSTPSIQSLCSRWRNGRGCPSRAVLAVLPDLVDQAERYLVTSKHRAEVLDARRKMLRAALWKLPHGSCKNGGINLKVVAETAGLDRQLLTNFRCGDRPMGQDKVDALEKAMRKLKLI